LGWAGPAQRIGPDSAPKCVGPREYGISLLGSTRPRRQGWARIRLAQQPKRAGGIIFPPPLHAERYSFCMQRRKKNKHEGEEELPGAGEAVACCVSGGAVAEDDREGGRPFFLSSLLFSSSALFSPVSFASSVNHVLPSLQRLRGGAGGGGEETDDASRWL